MALSSITMQMLASGFAGCKLFGFKDRSTGHVLFTLLPAVGVFGAIWWGKMAAWVPVPTNIVCGLFLPIAYLGFLILNQKRDFLGSDKPRGALAGLWSLGMVVAIVVISAGLLKVLITDLPKFVEKIGGS